MTASPFCSEFPSTGVHQIHQWKNEHPDQIDKVPVQARGFNVTGIVASLVVAPRDNQECNDAANDVGQMEPRDAEEARAELRRAASGIGEQPPALPDHLEPFPQVQDSEHRTQK